MAISFEEFVRQRVDPATQQHIARYGFAPTMAAMMNDPSAQNTLNIIRQEFQTAMTPQPAEILSGYPGPPQVPATPPGQGFQDVAGPAFAAQKMLLDPALIDPMNTPFSGQFQWAASGQAMRDALKELNPFMAAAKAPGFTDPMRSPFGGMLRQAFAPGFGDPMRTPFGGVMKQAFEPGFADPMRSRFKGMFEEVTQPSFADPMRSPLQGVFSRALAGDFLDPMRGSAGDALRFGLSQNVLNPDANPYLARYAQGVVNPLFENLRETILPDITSQAIGAGGRGGSRQALMQSGAIGKTMGQAGDALSQLYSQAYGQGLQHQQAMGDLFAALQGQGQQFTTGMGSLYDQMRQGARQYQLGVGDFFNQMQQGARQFQLGAGNIYDQMQQGARQFQLGAGNLADQYQQGRLAHQLGMGNLYSNVLGQGLDYQANMANIYNQMRQGGLGSLQAGLNMAPQTAMMGMLPAQMMQQMGAQQEARLAGIAQNMMNYDQNRLQNYMQVVGAPYGGSGFSSQAVPGAPSPSWGQRLTAGVGGGLGMGLLGAAAGGSTWGGPLGLGMGALGALGGLFG